MIAAVEPSTFDNPLTWLNFGALGLVVLGLLTGWIWAKPAIERMIQERDRLIGERDQAAAQRDAAVEVLQERLIPVVSEFLIQTRALLPVLQEIQRLQELVPALQDFVQSRSGEDDGRGKRPKSRRP